MKKKLAFTALVLVAFLAVGLAARKETPTPAPPVPAADMWTRIRQIFVYGPVIIESKGGATATPAFVADEHGAGDVAVFKDAGTPEAWIHQGSVEFDNSLNLDGDLDLDGTGLDADVSGAISLDADTASNFNVSGSGLDLTLESEAGCVIIKGDEAVVTAVTIDADDNAATGLTIAVGATHGAVLDGGRLQIGGLDTYSRADGVNDVAVEGDIEAKGGLYINGATVLTGTVVMDGDLVKVGGSTAFSRADGVNDLGVEGDLEVRTSLYVETNALVTGTLGVDGVSNLDDLDVDASAEINFDGGLVDIGDDAAQAYTRADGDNDLGIAADLEVRGNAYIIGTATITGTTTLAAGDIAYSELAELARVSYLSQAITYTTGAGGTATLATIADGEIWIVHGVYVQTTTNWTVTAGDDETLTVGDGNDADGFIAATHTELLAAFTEATGYAAGWYGVEDGSDGAYTQNEGGFIYAPSGGTETIDIAWGATGDDLTAGASTIWLVYTRIQ